LAKIIPQATFDRHPPVEAAYFATDLVTRDQVEDYARREKAPRAEVERWLAPNLAYEAD
jgi:5-methyltetrahydrofolate--homocysteine methyltransferase